ncbi:hypothetical protein HBA55_35030 [Pseudomaricurvus alkylphenolicus]|uniref:hypothetical protein n=1 Tax=Pseudomaricurvus alkylphenolicus TaxID=1306991 RepID=UPI0014226C4C|nr:hypothetical protein [Pseudomaricurvus alkylphenolicus]NIB44848.1 hypothetical protein [Pseudomaricurvus alkylphenolicus]
MKGKKFFYWLGILHSRVGPQIDTRRLASWAETAYTCGLIDGKVCAFNSRHKGSAKPDHIPARQRKKLAMA